MESESVKKKKKLIDQCIIYLTWMSLTKSIMKFFLSLYLTNMELNIFKNKFESEWDTLNTQSVKILWVISNDIFHGKVDFIQKINIERTFRLFTFVFNTNLILTVNKHSDITFSFKVLKLMADISK